MQAMPAYFAGYFDGEGCVTLKRQCTSRTFLTRVTFCTAYRPIADLFRRQFGGQVRAKATFARKPLYYWEMTRHADVLRFLQMIAPYSMEKRDQVLLAIQWLEHQPPCHRRFRKCRDSTYDFDAGEKCFLELKALKRVGW